MNNPSIENLSSGTVYRLKELVTVLEFVSNELSHQTLSQQMDELSTNLKTYLEKGNV